MRNIDSRLITATTLEETQTALDDAAEISKKLGYHGF